MQRHGLRGTRTSEIAELVEAFKAVLSYFQLRTLWKPLHGSLQVFLSLLCVCVCLVLFMFSGGGAAQNKVFCYHTKPFGVLPTNLQRHVLSLSTKKWTKYHSSRFWFSPKTNSWKGHVSGSVPASFRGMHSSGNYIYIYSSGYYIYIYKSRIMSLEPKVKGFGCYSVAFLPRRLKNRSKELWVG